MNFDKLLQEQVQVWIEANKKKNIYDLALKKSPFAQIPMRDLIQQIQGRKIAEKKFSLLNSPKILFPPKLNLEQTSSRATAIYKANIVKGKTIVDITGGLGIDSIFFAESFEQVFHVEKNETLQKIAAHNFDVLKLNHIKSIADDGISFLSNFKEKIDVIYIDPSRRDHQKKKVFLLEDLQPNIIKYADLFSERATEVLIKLSPLIDIPYLYKTLPRISAFYVVAVKNEVKEVLVKLNKNKIVSPIVHVVNLDTEHHSFNFELEDSFHTSSPTSLIQKYVYEPNAAIQKSGGNDLLANDFGLYKLHPNTQLYTSDKVHQDFPGRIFEVLDDIKNPKKELKNKSILAVHRNFSTKLPNLQKKYKFKLDGIAPVLFTRNLNNYLITYMRRIK